MRRFGLAGTAMLLGMAAACADPVAVKDLRPLMEGSANLAVGTNGHTSDQVGTTGTITVRYVCRNTFEVVNGWQVPAALYWKSDNGLASGQLEIPAGGVATFDASQRSLNRTVQLYSDAARTKLVATVVHGNRTCSEVTSGNAIRLLSFGASCGSTLTLSNSGPKTLRVAWRDLGSRREGLISVPPALATGAQMVLSFDVGSATTIEAKFGTASLGTVTAASGTACREGAVLSWKLLGSSAPGGVAVRSTYAEPLDAIFVTDGPDYGPGRVWRIDLASNQTTELPSISYPYGKYRQIVYDERNNRVVTYWDGLGQAHALPVTGGTWSPIGSSGNSNDHYEGVSFWNPVNSAVGLWGGYGGGAFRNTFWSLNDGTGTWSLLVPAGATPWGRISPSAAVDRGGSRLFVTGGEGSSTGGQFHPTQQFLADLWSLDLTTQQWTNIIPVGGGTPAYLGPIAYVGGENALYRFGGMDRGVRNDVLARVDLAAGAPAFVPVHVYGARPSPRWGFGLHYDTRRNRLVLVSGHLASGWTDDLWELQLP